MWYGGVGGVCGMESNNVHCYHRMGVCVGTDLFMAN